MEAQREYLLDGLCCPNCAAEIEKEVNALQGVSAAKVDFVSRTLTMVFDEDADETAVLENAGAIARRHDPDVVLSEKACAAPGRKTVYLLGLCCPECAQRIADGVRKLDGVKSAELDFVQQKLTVEAHDERELPAVLRQAAAIVHEIEPDVTVSYAAQREDDSRGKKRLYRWAMLIAGTVIGLAAWIAPLLPVVKLILFLISYLLIGGEIILQAVRNILKGRVFDENFLMTVATAGAFCIGEYPEGVAVMLFYRIGEFFQDLAVGRSRRSIEKLMDIRPDFANLQIDGEVRRVPPEEVGVGDVIVVKPGERVPLDGVVSEGASALDMSALTGESLPLDVSEGDNVLSGAINRNGLIAVRVTKAAHESTAAKILDLVENASAKKAKTESFITRFARYYTPVVTFAALALAIVPPLVTGTGFSEWIHRALAFLVVSCPCALVISVPLSFFGGIGAASRAGILVKGSNYLEALERVDTLVMDKTGTLTKGVFEVVKISPANGFTEADVLRWAACAEQHSNHPIAKAVRLAFGAEAESVALSEQEENAGFGVSARAEGKRVVAGNAAWLAKNGISFAPDDSSAAAKVYVAVDGVYAGCLFVADEMKKDSARALREIKALGVRKLVMLTGDGERAARETAAALQIDEVHAQLLPQDKVERFEKLLTAREGNGAVAFVGDGINDAPVLARADVGIAMGAIGSDAAIEAADVVLMTDEISRIADSIRIAKRTKRIVWENILFALLVKIVLLVLAALGVASMWVAVFGDVGVTILAVINSMRAMKTEKTRTSVSS